MKIRRKTQQCLNCGLTLNTIYHYCPRCGQENNDNNVSFGTFVQEFFANYLSFDTKFAHSVVPFLIKPGFLTNRFNEGKRVSYVHPLRLYLIISVVFFFLATWLVRSTLEEISLEDAALDAASSNAAPEVAALDSASAEVVDQVDPAEAFFGLRQVTDVLEDESLTDEEALDSLQRMDSFEIDSTAFTMRFFRQIRRVAQNDLDVFAGFVLQNMPIMMFMLIPLFALLLKLLYIRREKLYVQHLVHALHLHAFVLFLFSLLLLLFLAFNISDPVGNWLITVASWAIVVYVYFSFWRVYQQGWFKTLVKLFMVGIVYFWILFIFGLSEAMISFMIF
ncbi:MAG: DUF3667 domain-containing protein [Cyclobacteriaceae bacterium]